MTRGWSVRPGRTWRVLRIVMQVLGLVAIVVAPVLGGWQRLERSELSSWRSPETELPPVIFKRLPGGEAAANAYRANAILGGGSSAELFTVPLGDPVLAAAAMLHVGATLRGVVTVLIPLLLALIAGRVFCGWFCPFGTISRLLQGALAFLPIQRKAIPPQRPLRYALLAIGLLLGAFGAHVVLYLLMPHVLLQQSLYAMWLLGGGGAVLGLLLGLLVVGAFFGPTSYCAALCPTGGALGLAGRARVVRLQIASPAKCGSACRLCSQACWIQLDPASGDPGPDCDLCGRCVPACPRTNLEAVISRKTKANARRRLATLAVLLAVVPSPTRAQRTLPRLSLATERVVDDVTIAIDVVDQTGIRLSADSDVELRGSDLSVFIARGPMDEPDEDGLIASREVYRGPLQVTVQHGGRIERLRFDEPTSPRSTPRRAIYRERIPIRMRAGDSVVIEPIADWLPAPQRFEVPTAGIDASPSRLGTFLVGGMLFFGGLLSISLALKPGTNRRARTRAPRA